MVATKKFLHVGCGPVYKDGTTSAFASEGWQEVRLDIDKSVNPDIISSVLDLSIIDSESFDAIFSSHNIEHVYAHQIPIMLKEFLRVLNTDGFLVVICPNLIPVAHLILEEKFTEPAYTSPDGPIYPLDILHGHGKSIEKGYEFMAHKTGFTPKSLKLALSRAGFKSVAVMAQDFEKKTAKQITGNSAMFNILAFATKKKINSKDKMMEIIKPHFQSK